MFKNLFFLVLMITIIASIVFNFKHINIVWFQIEYLKFPNELVLTQQAWASSTNLQSDLYK